MTFFFHYLTNKAISRKHSIPVKRRRKSMESAPQTPQNQNIEDGEGDDDPQQQEGEELIYPFHIMDLPSHIVFDILSRLPVKSILICRCVCKTWHSLIADPHFTKLRLDRGDVEIFLRTDSTISMSRTLHLVDLEKIITSTPPHDLCDKRETKIDMRFCLPKREVKDKRSWFIKCEFSIVNSCNGFLCLRKNSSKSPCIVCNPITGEFITLPKPEKEQNIRSAIVAGFGCSSRSNEYKVVRLVFQDLALIPTDRMAEVYTLGTISWRSVGYAPNDLVLGLCPTYFNGAMHWLCDDEGPDFILAFDFEDEKFRSVTPPPHFSEKEKDLPILYQMSMGVLGGCLFVGENTLPTRFDIWVMKDYGVQESWIKEFSIDLTSWGRCRPIKCLDNGQLVMICEYCSLVLYNPVEGHFRMFNIREARSVTFEAIVHIPSFASLKHVAGGDNLKVQSVFSRWAESELWEEAEALSLVEGGNLGMMGTSNFW